MTTSTVKHFIVPKQEMFELKHKVRNLLSFGHHNSVTARQIAEWLNISDPRRVRLVIRELIKDGVPIASSITEPMGFYIVKTPEEASRYIRYLKQIIRQDQIRLRDFEAACESFNPPEQQNLL